MVAIAEANKHSWIPPSERTRDQMLLTDSFHQAIDTFENRNTFLDDLPDQVILYDLELKANNGVLLPRPWQQTGSCVGVGGFRSYCHAICGDIVVRGDLEAVIPPFPFMTYGVGRRIAGMNGPGEGSFGGAQAEAIKQFGMLPYTDPRFPKPKIKDGWIYWTKEQELQWSHPRSWPVKESELKPDAAEHQIQDVTQITSFQGLLQALAQGFGVTTASMFGTRPRVEGDYLIGHWNDSWSHQQSWSGYTKHSKYGYIVLFDNQWNDLHGHCPFLFDTYGATGSYWTPQEDIEKVIARGEVYAHSNTEGFPTQEIDWGTMGIG